MPSLVTPSTQWIDAFRAALREAAEIGEVVPWDPAHDCDAPTMLAAVDAMANGIWGPGATDPTQVLRWWVDGDRYVGRISLRFVEFRETHPSRYAGHGDIGYDVRPSARGMGEATAMLAAMLNVAEDLGYPDALITCDTTNVASRRVLEKAGGSFVDTYDDEGEPVLRYRFSW